MLRRTLRGIGLGLRSRLGVALFAGSAVAVFNLVAPVLILSALRRPADLFVVNPWLRRLGAFLFSGGEWSAKLAVLAQLKLGWVSADAADGVDWVFVVDVPALSRIALAAALFGAYFALWSYRRGTRAGAGVACAATSVFGLTTCPCSLAGSSAPVLFAFSSLPAATVAVLATASQTALALALIAVTAAVLRLGWEAGATTPP